LTKARESPRYRRKASGTGHFADKFRPHNTLHRELSGLDYRNGFYDYNVVDGPCRPWDDYDKFGFISAGQGVRWRDALMGFQPGDGFAAYQWSRERTSNSRSI
jgi:hypothetical protein